MKRRLFLLFLAKSAASEGLKEGERAESPHIKGRRNRGEEISENNGMRSEKGGDRFTVVWCFLRSLYIPAAS